MGLQKASAVAGIVSAIIAVATFAIFLNDRSETESAFEAKNKIETPVVVPELEKLDSEIKNPEAAVNFPKTKSGTPAH